MLVTTRNAFLSSKYISWPALVTHPLEPICHSKPSLAAASAWMIALGLSDPGSGEGAGQVLREPPWDSERALLPADARLHGREKLALQMLSIRHRMELIYFVGTFCVCVCVCVRVCVFAYSICVCVICVRVSVHVYV